MDTILKKKMKPLKNGFHIKKKKVRKIKMLMTTYKGLIIMYRKSQVSMLKNIVKQYSTDLQVLKTKLNNNNIECY